MKNGRYLIKKLFKKFVEICVFPAFVMIGLTFVMGFYQERNIYLKLNDITLELGEKLPEEITRYMNLLPSDGNLKIESNVLLDEEGNTKAIGIFNYYLVYTDDKQMFSKLTNVKSTITVIDTIKPTVRAIQDVKIKYGDKVKTADLVECFDLSGCKMTFEEEVDTTKSGNYEVTIKAIDGGNNVSYINTKFTVLEKPKPKPVYVYNYSQSYSASVQQMNEKNNAKNASLTDEEKINMRYAIANFAKQFIGNPYVHGGTSLTNGADCSGFTMSLYANFGYSLPRIATTQGAMGKAVSEAELQPGDLIIYTYGHAGIYVGNGLMVHAATSQSGIVMQPMFAGYRIYRRIIY